MESCDKRFYEDETIEEHNSTVAAICRNKLERWLNKSMKIQMTDGRTLIGIFVCTDRDKNVILGSCEEYLKPPDEDQREEPRILGLAMVPGHHIVSIHIDDNCLQQQDIL